VGLTRDASQPTRSKDESYTVTAQRRHAAQVLETPELLMMNAQRDNDVSRWSSFPACLPDSLCLSCPAPIPRLVIQPAASTAYLACEVNISPGWAGFIT
jgi:hypothetical protein